MNDTLMVQTEINNENNLSTNKIQLELKPILKDEQNSTDQTSSLELVTLSKAQDNIVVN
jgi:hypothetical protein